MVQQSLLGPSGTISFPGTTSGLYEDNAECEWLIQVEEGYVSLFVDLFTVQF